MATNASAHDEAKPLGSDGGRPRSAIVTGAAAGIGQAVATALAEAGWSICGVDISDLEATAQRVQAAGSQLAMVRGDVADSATYLEAVAGAKSSGTLEAAVLCAGTLTGEGEVTRVSDERYRRVVATNVDGVFLGLRELLRTPRHHQLRLVVIASSVGLVPAPHDPVYAMTKHALVGLVRSLSMRPELEDVRLSCLCPNGVDTGMLSAELRAGRRLLTSTDVARAVMLMLDEAASGEAWVCTPDLLHPFDFAPNPGYEFPALDR